MTYDEMKALAPGQAVLSRVPFKGFALHPMTVVRVHRETTDVRDATGRVHRIQWHGLRHADAIPE